MTWYNFVMNMWNWFAMLQIYNKLKSVANDAIKLNVSLLNVNINITSWEKKMLQQKKIITDSSSFWWNLHTVTQIKISIYLRIILLLYKGNFLNFEKLINRRGSNKPWGINEFTSNQSSVYLQLESVVSFLRKLLTQVWKKLCFRK